MIIIPQESAQLSADHGYAVCGKPHLLGQVKIVDGFDQTDHADLEQIINIFPSAGKALDHAEHQPQVAVDQLVPCFLAAGALDLPQQFDFFAFLEYCQLRGVDSGDDNLLIRHAEPSVFFLWAVSCAHCRMLHGLSMALSYPS